MEKISIVYQTHWDREWYYDVDTYNIRFKKVISRVVELLESDTIRYFVLDGQVKALEDYFSICEDHEKYQVLQLIKENRIVIGPWYVLSDEFLVSGESLVRNLELGIKKSNEFGNYQKVGYLPDTFGHISQMPQILKNFNINNSILWRGVLPKDTFFNWEAPNKDKVFTVFLKEGYYQPIVDQENYLSLMETFIKKQSDFTKYKNILLTNGGDHLAPAKTDLIKNINSIEEKFDLKVQSTNYEEYIDDVEDKSSYEVIKGELRNNQNCYVLPNVLSTRYNIKKQNQLVEEKIKSLEALIAAKNVFNKYQHQSLLNNIWENIIVNHPHDSICGCSIDDVHSEMMTRYKKINHQLNGLIKEEHFKQCSYSDVVNSTEKNIFSDYTKFNIFNPTTRRMNEFRKVKVFINKESDLIDNFIVTDGFINYTTTILNKKETRIFESPIDYFPEFRQGYEYEILFRVKDLKGLQSRNYSLTKGTPLVLEKNTRNFIENDYVKIAVSKEGSLDVTDKISGKTYHKQNVIYSSLDQGDEYNYSKPTNDLLSFSTLKSVETLNSKYFNKLKIELELKIPKGLNSDFNTPSDCFVTNNISLEVELLQDSHEIYCNLNYENNAESQRTRMLFESNKEIRKHYSDTAFDIVERSVRNEEFKAEKNREVKVVVDPSLSLIISDNGLRINHFGLQEYQVNKQGVHVTLLRSVGSISRDDLHSRGGGAGPSFSTPDAQMIGTFNYSYSLSFNEAPLFENNDQFRQDLIVSKGHTNSLQSLLEINNSNIFVSSIRKNKDTVELRIFNPSEKTESYQLKSSYSIQKVVLTNFLGDKKQGDIYQVKPKEIQTLQITLQTVEKSKADVYVAGGSIGAVRSAVKLLEKGKNVILTEETSWLGGQLTSQAVPLDEHPFIEDFGCTKSYREFRNNARKYYIKKYNLESCNNPGNGWVSRLSFEPKVAKELFDDMVSKYEGKNLRIFYNTKPISSISNENTVKSVTVENKITNKQFKIEAKYFIDGTELGDLLPITNTSYVTGAEGNSSNEPSNDVSDKEDMQPVTHVISLEWKEGNKELLEKPKRYDYFKSLVTPYSDKFVLSEFGPDSSTGKERAFNIREGRMPLWSYRRFFDPKTLHTSGTEKTTINWPQNDYFLGNIFDNEFEDIHRENAKELTKSFVYYLQTEMIRNGENKGYPEMKVITTALGTDDGLAMYPYIREARRIKAKHTIKEQDISGNYNKELPKVKWSVGVGCYHIDLHITTKSHKFFYDNTWPFEIPLGALIPETKENLIPACKNIGTTHITNGSFRLHPVEWNIGESAGLLVNYLFNNNLTSQEFYSSDDHKRNYQQTLIEEGIELHWDKDKVHIV